MVAENESSVPGPEAYPKQMLSFAMFGDMNRSEQESLYRTSRKLSLVPNTRRNSQSNILERRISCYEGSVASRGAALPENLVLSVLKSPVNHVASEPKNMHATTAEQDNDVCAEASEEDAR